jgi:hypothetical protein
MCVHSCNACSCERVEEAKAIEPAAAAVESASDLAAESEPRATLAERLRPDTLDMLKYLFAQMDLERNGRVTREEAEAFFVVLFDELPLKELDPNDDVGAASVSEAAALRRSLSQEQSAALFPDAHADREQMLTIDDFVGFWGKVKAFGYSEREILSGLTSALKRGTWRQKMALAASPAWAAAPLPSTTSSHPESCPSSATLPGVPSSAVLPLQESPELDRSESDEDEPLDEIAGREWCRLLGCSAHSDTEFAAASHTPTHWQMILSPE